MNYRRIKKNFIFLLSGLIGVCIFLSCAKNVTEEGIEIVQIEDHVVTLSMAKKSLKNIVVQTGGLMI